MRPYILVMIFVSVTIQSFSQNEMESTCMQKIKEFSADIHFPKFIGLTTISKDTIKFDNSIIIIRSTNPEFVKIFEFGFVYPDLIYGASTVGDKYEFKKNYGNDTLSISNVSQLHFPNQSPSTKSFSFLLWEKNMANPSLYLFELINETATQKTTTMSFIEKAKISAFGFCSILI